MFKRDNLKGFIVGIVFTLVIVSTFGVFASGQINKTIQVLYDNIKLVVNGSPVDFGNDLAGNKIEPFILDGTTYLPVRAVGEALAQEVDWNGNTNTVYVGNKDYGEVVKDPIAKPSNEKFEYMTEVIEPTAKGINTKITKLDGRSGKIKLGEEEYQTGYRFHESDGQNYMIFKLDGKYTEIKGSLGIEQFSDLSTNEFSIYLDDELYKTIVVDPTEYPKEISIAVTGVDKIKFESPGKNYAQISFVNPKIR